MSPHPQTTSGPPSKLKPPSSPTVIFELNQARRKKVTRELEALRSGTCPKFSELDFRETLTQTLSAAFLEWPTSERRETFAEKKVEYDEMMDDHVTDLEAVIREQIVFIQGKKRAAKLAEERRLQEFQRALERMDPAEAEAARSAERERAFRLQRQSMARLAELDAKWASIRDGVRAESP
jgi:hypothetical protein